MAGIRQQNVSLGVCWVEESRGCHKVFRQREMYFLVFFLILLLVCNLSVRLNF